MKRIEFWIVLLTIVAGANAQRTLHVPAKYPTITRAHRDARNGDIVLVQPGRYVEPALLIVKEITVRSAAGPWVTTIDVNGGQSVVVSSQFRPVVLDGFTVTGATNSGVRAGYNAQIRNCVVTGNRGRVGGGIFVAGANNLIERCVIAGNVADFYGGGIGTDDQTAPVIRHNMIAGNVAMMIGGGVWLYHTDLVANSIVGNVAGFHGGGVSMGFFPFGPLVSNVIAGNVAGLDGGGVYVIGEYVNGENNTIAGNRCGRDGGGMYLGQSTWMSNNAIISGNRAAGRGDELALRGGQFTIDHAILRQSPGAIYATYTTPSIGTAVLDLDPGFVDLAGNDYHVLLGSFAVDGGVASTIATVDFEGDPRPTGRGMDLGADEAHPRFWVAGDARPGGTIRLRAIGIPGQPVVLAMTTDARLRRPGLVLPGIGTWSLVGPVAVVPLGPIPATGLLDVALTVPPTTPVPLDVPMQATIGTALYDVVVVSVR